MHGRPLLFLCPGSAIVTSSPSLGSFEYAYDVTDGLRAFAWPRLKKGQISDVISIGILTKHLISFRARPAPEN